MVSLLHCAPVVIVHVEQDYAAMLCAVASKVDPSSVTATQALGLADRVVSALEVSEHHAR